MYVNKCVAINKQKQPIELSKYPKFNILMRCKAKHNNESILCPIHKKHKPDFIILDLDNINNKWITHKFIDEASVPQQKQTYITELEAIRIIQDIEELETFNSIVKCSVCFENSENHTELIHCSNSTPASKHNHFICKDCLKGHIQCLISDSIGTNTCMFDKTDKCAGEYKILDIKTVLDTPEQIAHWEEIVNISEIIKLASICDDYVICPLCCKWGCIFETPPGAIMNYYIPCGKCGEKWCNICKRKKHDNRSCYTLEFLAHETVDSRIAVIDRMIQEIVTKSLTHCCSTCGCAYIKEEGCNLMVCPRCESMTCYLCDMKLYYKNNTKYWHFVGHELSDPDTVCALWNNNAGDGKALQGNTEYNEKSITKELKKFLLGNTPDISKIICSRIIIIFAKDESYASMINAFTHLNIY